MEAEIAARKASRSSAKIAKKNQVVLQVGITVPARAAMC